MSNADHFAANQANWNNRAPLHASRDKGYQIQQYIDDPKTLSNVVQFDIPRLPDLKGKRVVHLQCHIGTDTLSLSRLGAVDVVGLDFSSESISAARALTAESGDDITFVEANVYDARKVLDGTFDVVFTGIGALCWLPDIGRWAGVVASLLAPGGVLFMREGHPIMWSVDETLEGGPTVRFPYFNKPEPMEWNEENTYVETEKKITATKTFIWNHGLGELVTALLKEGLVLEMLEEHDCVPWEAMPGMMEKRKLDEWGLKERSGSMPLTYTLVARKPARQ